MNKVAEFKDIRNKIYETLLNELKRVDIRKMARKLERDIRNTIYENLRAEIEENNKARLARLKKQRYCIQCATDEYLQEHEHMYAIRFEHVESELKGNE